MEMIEIEAFVAIARAGSISRAAVTLHLSQPAMSRRIDLLEREIGVPLFDRVPSGVRLTDAGEAFLPYARQVLAAARDGAEAARALEAEERGTVTLALVGTLANTRLTMRLRAFRDGYPQVRLLIHTARSDEVSAMVQRGEAQLGLRYFAVPDRDLIALPIADEPLRVVSAGQSRLVAPTTTDVRALVGVPWVGFPQGALSSGEPFARAVEQQLFRCGLGDAEYIAIDSLTAQKRLIEADFGVGLMPTSAIEEEVRLGTLRTLSIPALAITVPVTVVHRRNGYLSGAARRLLSSLADPA
ncbi:MAG: LysR family transcriptional regulator [Chloroflexota bacterium]|nr:LysR family transcriptional regulator [Chloroflexota bacterium]